MSHFYHICLLVIYTYKYIHLYQYSNIFVKLDGQPDQDGQGQSEHGNGSGNGNGSGRIVTNTEHTSTNTSNNSNVQNNRLYIGNLEFSVDWKVLKDHLKQFGGDLKHVDIGMHDDGRSKGYAIAGRDSVWLVDS